MVGVRLLTRCLGLRDPGSPFAYVTDTRPAPELPQFLKGVDLLVCEGTYGSDEDLPKAVRNRHMTFREAAALARDASANRLWITHFSPALEDPGGLRGERHGGLSAGQDWARWDDDRPAFSRRVDELVAVLPFPTSENLCALVGGIDRPRQNGAQPAFLHLIDRLGRGASR